MRALIIGVGGQDGSYLANFLLSKGYEIIGSSRDAEISQFSNLKNLGIFDKVKKISISINNFESVSKAINFYKPDEIYNLAGQSSVSLSFEQPFESIESIVKATLIILNAIKSSGKPIKFYSAGSSECFGNTNSLPADENTKFNPCSPYGISKASSYWLVQSFRSRYQQYACTGILFNHESPLRPKIFVTQKIIQTVLKIKDGRANKLYLGNIHTKRDWGWAPEYVEAIWLMLQQDIPEDFVIATGKSYSLLEFTKKVFKYFSLDWQDFVVVDKTLFRPKDINHSFANPSLAKEKLGWAAKVNFDELIVRLCEH
tara:strand:- start:389 stop:1330 length:942 start_codon:yes stop_codon:yes gene_type:complete